MIYSAGHDSTLSDLTITKNMQRTTISCYKFH